MAEELLASGVATEALAARARQVRVAVDAAVTDSALLVELDRIRLEQAAVKDEHFDAAGAAPLYAKALAEYGIDLAAPEASAARVRDSRLREALLAALADWGRVTQDDGERQRVVDVFQLALPPGSYWARWIAAVRRGDGPGLVKLAKEPALQELPAAFLVLMARRFAAMKEWAAAEQILRAGLERNPGDFWLNHQLGMLLKEQQPPRAEGAVRYLTAALALRPDSPGVHLNLGLALEAKGDEEGAITRYRAALQIDPTYGAAHYNLGSALARKGQLDEAIAEFHKAIQLKKSFADAHGNLGTALRKKGQLDEAIAEYNEVLGLNKDDPLAHCHLGSALADKGQLDQAISEYKEALRLKKDFPEAHYNLGLTLWRKGQVDEAIACYKKAIELDPKYAEAHSNLGLALYGKGRLDEAIAEFRGAIRLKKDYPEAHCNLGLALQQKGQFIEALVYLRRGHELGSKNPRWPYPSAQWARNCERLVELDGKLPAILSGQKQPADTAERLTLASLCQQHKHRHAAAVRFYNEAFADKPQLADDLNAGHRYNAACAAALAGCGQGKDADKLDTKECARLRKQALDWLRADLKAYRQVMDKSADKAGPTIAQRMQHWLADTDFTGVRGAESLARLPVSERQDWQKLWADVTDLFTRAGGKSPGQEK
jgi:tetratricopeptide (TPR) repeat protein